MEQFDVVIVGAGAAGMICAVEAGRRGRRVLLVDHNRVPGEKIRISGGGRCNFTNLDIRPEAYISQNPKFALSALHRFNQWDFINRLDKAGITWHEKTLGQLFCDGTARQVVEMLLRDITEAGVEMRLGTGISEIRQTPQSFTLLAGDCALNTQALVIATGGKSIPKMGASGFGYRVAEQFGIKIEETRPALVPLTFGADDLTRLTPLAGVSLPASVSAETARFDEGLLFTHRGLSGPSILQISSYWREGQGIRVDLLPGQDAMAVLMAQKQQKGGSLPETALARLLPKRLAVMLAAEVSKGRTLADLKTREVQALGRKVNDWQLTPTGSEGYRTAEVTLGGVSTDALDARTMVARATPGLYFIGEVVDVTGWLGGYNFQWAWSCGWAAGQVV